MKVVFLNDVAVVKCHSARTGEHANVSPALLDQ